MSSRYSLRSPAFSESCRELYRNPDISDRITSEERKGPIPARSYSSPLFKMVDHDPSWSSRNERHFIRKVTIVAQPCYHSGIDLSISDGTFKTICGVQSFS